MTTRITFLTLILLLTCGYTLPAQPFSQIRDVDILTDERIVLHLDYPHRFDTLVIIGRNDVSPHHTKISYLKDGIYCEAILNSDRKDMLLVANAVAIPQDEVPGPVMDAFKRSDYGDWKITRTLAVTTPYEPWFFAIDAEQGDTFLRLFYNQRGFPKNSPY